MEKSEPSYTVVGNIKWCSWCEKSLAGNQKVRIGIIFNSKKVVTQMSTDR